MNYIPLQITKRTEELKQAYLQLPVPQETNPYIDKKYRMFCTGDRWITLGYLRGWKKHSDAETTKLRAAYAEAEELYQAQPVILDNELLVGHLYLPEYSPSEQSEYDALCDAFAMSSYTLVERAPRKDHLALDFDKLLHVGINGIITEIENKLAGLDLYNPSEYPSFDVIKKQEFYQCLLIELNAVLDLAKRYSKAAKEMALTANEPRKSELLKISEIMTKVPANPASNFYEAIQSVQFYLGNLFGLYPLNRPDRYLYEYYQRDLEKGLITKEFAQELIDNFCLHVSARVFSRAATGFIVGGQDENGNLVENDLTYMFLTALDHLQLPDPNGAIAVNDKTSDTVLEYCVDILAHGTTHPAFYNDNAIVSSLVKYYKCERKDAVNYIHTTCAEISIVGKSKAHTTSFNISLPGLLLETAKTHPDCQDYLSFEKFYFEAIKEFYQKQTLSYLTRTLEASRIGNEPLRPCALIDNCIERGKGLYEGGEKYTFFQPICVGFSTTVDSLIALESLVFNKKKLTLAQFNDIVENDFENNESFRQYLINKLPHYGNDNETADKKAENLAKNILSLFDGNDIPFKQHLILGTFSYINHATIGAETGATFDGRKKGYSLSDGCSAVQGRDVNGPTAMIKSLTSWEQSKLLGGMVVNIKLGKSTLTDENKRKFITLLKTFIKRGGLEMQVNVVDKQTLEDARNNPENYQNLLVRIGGFSDYFVRLTPVLQQEVIDRTEY